MKIDKIRKSRYIIKIENHLKILIQGEQNKDTSRIKRMRGEFRVGDNNTHTGTGMKVIL